MLDRGLRSGHGAGACLMTGLFRKNSKADEGSFVQLPNRGFLFLCKTLANQGMDILPFTGAL